MSWPMHFAWSDLDCPCVSLLLACRIECYSITKICNTYAHNLSCSLLIRSVVPHTIRCVGFDFGLLHLLTCQRLPMIPRIVSSLIIPRANVGRWCICYAICSRALSPSTSYAVQSRSLSFDPHDLLHQDLEVSVRCKLAQAEGGCIGGG